MIRENEPITNHFISVPRDYGKLNVAAYLAGIIEGILLASSFVSVKQKRLYSLFYGSKQFRLFAECNCRCDSSS